MTFNNRGAGLMDALVSIFLLGTAGIVFAASFPTGFSALQQSCEATKATAVAQQKIEQIRSLDYDKLDYDYLLAAGFIDTYPTGCPYHFEAVDAGQMTDLKEPAATLNITEDADQDLKHVVVSIDWDSSTNDVRRNVTLTTIIADSTPLVRQ